MCPVCIATVAWIAAGTTSTGGIAALVVSTLRGKNQEPETNNPELTTNVKNQELRRET